MSNPSDFFADVKLAEALRGLPTPEPAADFDDRVLAALRVSVPWWQRVWQPVQPLLLGTSCSLALTLLLLHLNAPISAPAFAPAALPALAANSRPMPPLDALLDRPNLCAGSLAAVWNSPSVSDEAESRQEKAGRRLEPRRRAAVSCRPALMA